MSGLTPAQIEELNQRGEEISSEPRHFDPEGRPIGLGDWADLFERRIDDLAAESWWRKQTKIGDVEITTVWTGLAGVVNDAPLIWETRVWGGDHDGEEWGYKTRGEAFDHHEELLREIKAAK